MDIAPPPAPAPTGTYQLSKEKRHFFRYVFGLIALLLVLAVVALAYWFPRSSYGAFYGLHYLSGTYPDRSLQEFDIKGTHPVTFSNSGKVIDYAHAAGVSVGIEVNASGHQDIYSLGNKSVALTTDGGTKAALAVSPDGKTVAYADRLSEVVATSTADFYNVSAWQIKMLTIKDKTTKTIGVGFAPHFFTSNGVSYIAYITKTSIRIINLATLGAQDVPFDFGKQHSYISMDISPDGTFALLPDVADNYRLYVLTDTSGLFRLSAGSPLPEGTVMAAFKGKTIISAAYDTDHSLIRTSTTDQPNIIHYARIIPRSLIFKLIP
jgi:roadblock/LC7 domain-containing protein